MKGVVVEDAMWSEIVKMLSDPELLRRAVADGLVREEAADGATRESAKVLAGKITRLERALGDQLADLTAAGFGAAEIQHAAGRLRDDLERLRRQHSQALAWEATQSERTDQVRHLWEVASQLAEGVKAADPAARRRIIEVLDVTVQVTGWETCPECDGTGKQAGVYTEPADGRRRTAANCPRCQAVRLVPLIVVDGVLPMPTTDADTIAADVPFRALRAV